MIKITSIAQLVGIKADDVLIDKSTSNSERFLIKQVDDMKVVLLRADNSAGLKLFPKMNLLSENWWLEVHR